MRAAPNLGADYDRAFDAIYPALAEASGAILYPFFLDGVAGDAKLNQPDGLHPTAAGVAVIVEPDPAVGRGSPSPREALRRPVSDRQKSRDPICHSICPEPLAKLASRRGSPVASASGAVYAWRGAARGASMSSVRHILTLSCANRPGIVAKVSAALFDGGFNILDAQQFDDTETGDFFMRVEFNAARADADVGALRGGLQGDRRRLRHDMVDASRRPAQAGRADGVALRPLPGRSPLPLAQRRTADGAGGDHRQLSARNLRPHRFRRHPVPLSARSPRKPRWSRRRRPGS